VMPTSADSAEIDSSEPEIVLAPVGSTGLSSAVQIAMIAVFMLALLFAYGRWRTGSVELVWPWLMGRQLLFTPIKVELGNVSPNQMIEKQIRVINLSSKRLSIVGSQKSCGCIGLDEFPIDIDSGRSQNLRINIVAATAAGKFEHYVKFFTNSSSGNVVLITVLGTAVLLYLRSER